MHERVCSRRGSFGCRPLGPPASVQGREGLDPPTGDAHQQGGAEAPVPDPPGGRRPADLRPHGGSAAARVDGLAGAGAVPPGERAAHRLVGSQGEAVEGGRHQQRLPRPGDGEAVPADDEAGAARGDTVPGAAAALPRLAGAPLRGGAGRRGRDLPRGQPRGTDTVPRDRAGHVVAQPDVPVPGGPRQGPTAAAGAPREADGARALPHARGP
mmetsp:Transcript_20704/g.49328  ORF Transcript_20704/g.49328 Transcript_20704/m.49328 type:complete len:212 (-) Transcript_20704:687-1322(-)